MEQQVETVPSLPVLRELIALGKEVKRQPFGIEECTQKAAEYVPTSKSKQAALGNREAAFDQQLGDMLKRTPQLEEHLGAMRASKPDIQFESSAEGAVSVKGVKASGSKFGKQTLGSPAKIVLTTQQKHPTEKDMVVEKPTLDIVDDLIFEAGNIISFDAFDKLDDEFLKARGAIPLADFGKRKAEAEMRNTVVKHAQLVQTLIANGSDVGTKGQKTLATFMERYPNLLAGKPGPEAELEIADLCDKSHEPALIPVDKNDMADPAMKNNTWLSSKELSFYDKVVEMNSMGCLNAILGGLGPKMKTLKVLRRDSYPEQLERKMGEEFASNPKYLTLKASDLGELDGEWLDGFRGWITDSMDACGKATEKPFAFCCVVAIVRKKFTVDLAGCAFTSDMAKVAEANRGFVPTSPPVLLRPLFDASGAYLG